jgi:signal transduction histidine kinase
MTELTPNGRPTEHPAVDGPTPSTERRRGPRRAEDRLVHEEKVLLARTLDVLAAEGSAEERLAGLLRLLARTVGARRAAVVADGFERRAAVAIDEAEDPTEAEALAAWLDATAPRSRARRAAAGRAPISFIVGGVRSDRSEEPAARVASAVAVAPRPTARSSHFAMLRIPSAGEVALGFAFNRAVDAARVAERLPTAMARHAAVALALVTTQLADERQLAELRARDAERTTFISTVAHELRTPLTGLGGYLGLILDGKVDDPAVERDFLERSRTIVGSMAELVDDLLELSALESGSVQLDLGPFSIAEAGSQVAAGLLPIAISRDISLTTGFPPRLRVATGDRRRVEQILTNLAANALKFTPSGGAVEIEGHVDGLVALFVVRDDGDGIPADERSRIFERFHRLANHERISGTGLGLPIARDLARQMSGDLEVASVPGSGSSFVLALPGPTEVDEATVAASLRRTLDGEEIALEERMVRRAIAVADEAAASRYPGSAAARRGGRLRALPPLRSEPATLA